MIATEINPVFTKTLASKANSAIVRKAKLTFGVWKIYPLRLTIKKKKR